MREEFIQQFTKEGFFIMKNVFSPFAIREMQQRMDDLTSGKFFKKGRRFQVDTASGNYEDVSHENMVYQGPEEKYRKIADLEYDEVILKHLQNESIHEVCRTLVDEVVSIQRVTMMDKPAQAGTPLPWHQDIALNWPATHGAKLTIWFPLDPATAASGSLQVIPGSHHHGVIGNGHMLPKELEPKFASPDITLTVEMAAGDCLFFHPGVLHRSGVNRTGLPRRAINAIFMPGYSVHTAKNRKYPVLFGEGRLETEAVAKLTEIPT